MQWITWQSFRVQQKVAGGEHAQNMGVEENVIVLFGVHENR